MIRSHDVLLRHAQEFFLRDLVGLYVWDQVLVTAPEKVEPIPPNISKIERRKEVERREGRGRYIEQARVVFPLPQAAAKWEILIYSPAERPPVGEVILRDYDRTLEVASGPLDPATWATIGKHIRARS